MKQLPPLPVMTRKVALLYLSAPDRKVFKINTPGISAGGFIYKNSIKIKNMKSPQKQGGLADFILRPNIQKIQIVISVFLYRYQHRKVLHNRREIPFEQVDPTSRKFQDFS